jgi:long-chain acyl-CoA synthetase
MLTYAKRTPHGRGYQLYFGPYTMPENISMIEQVSALNKEYGNWEQIKKFVLLPKEFSIDGDELTPTLKLKRKKILAKYQKEYKSIYCD